MKTLALSPDDINNFNKLVNEKKAAQQVLNDDNERSQASSCNLMALQYYLKHPSNYPTPQLVQLQHPNQPQRTVQTHQQLLAQSQHQLKQLQMKQHSVYHHHPYYQQSTTAASVSYQSHVLNHNQSHTYNPNHTFPVHALNQNSNFSAASSSTGGGTTSSHAPTQQSNTTGSSVSPTNTINARSTPANTTAKNAATTLTKNSSRSSLTSGTKKLKTEPTLSQLQQTERLTFANTHMMWNETHWKRVLFQDERKFNLDGPDGFSYYFHDLRNYERTLSQRPRGNSVYIYILITSGGPIHLEVSTAKQNTDTCIATIMRERPNIIAKLGGNTDFILQDHNWISNALPAVQEQLNVEGIKTQKWPAISHDLDIMENIWGWLTREVYDGGRKFSRKDDLIFRIREAWSRLPLDLISNLYSTMPERISELYYTKGVYTNC